MKLKQNSSLPGGVSKPPVSRSGRHILTVPAMLAFLVSGTTAFAGYGKQCDLFIKNGDSVETTITISEKTEESDCMNMLTAPGTRDKGFTFTLAPKGQSGDSKKIQFGHSPARNCDGHAGVFYAQVKGHKLPSRFTWTENGPLRQSEANPERIVGTLKHIEGSGSDGWEYFWESPSVHRKITAGKAKGSWVKMGQGVINRKLSTTLTNQTTSEQTKSSEVKSAVSLSLEAGVEFKAFSAKATATTSQEKTTGESISKSVMSANTKADEQTIMFTQEQLRDFNIFAVWRWVATIPLSTGEVMLLETTEFTCTPDANPPKYRPGSQEDIESCRGGLMKKSAK